MSRPDPRKSGPRESADKFIHTKGELVHRWERKADDLDKIADRRETLDEDCTGLRNMAFTLRECALQLTQAKF